MIRGLRWVGWGIALMVCPLVMLLSGCTTVVEGVAEVGKATGVVTEQQATSMVRTARAIDKSFEDITPEQEYYLGRAVGATILTRYSVYRDEQLTRYVNLLGQSLALFSDKPLTYKGYSFLVLDSDEINAFAAPGGYIFVTRGMLGLCRSEDELAAVLAHEIGHVQMAHALKAIRTSRLTSAFTILGAEAARTFGGSDLAELTDAFEGSISDMSQTLMNSGYARSQEKEADLAAIQILKRAGYDPNALVRMLQTMGHDLKPGGPDFAKTHPPPEARIAGLRSMLPEHGPQPIPAARKARFAQAMNGL